MLRIITIFLLISLSFSASSQKFLKKLKQAVEDQLTEQPENSNLTDDRMQKVRMDQLKKDTSNYNYIFSQGNRASFFANREAKENLLLTFSKQYEDEETGVEAIELEIYEQAFDNNRTGEFSVYINPSTAMLNFVAAMGLLGGEYELTGIESIDSVINLSNWANMDTLSIEEKYALGKTASNIAITVNAQGRYQLSQELINEAIRYFKDELGENSIALASLYNNYAVVAQSQGKYIEAEDYFRLSENFLIEKGRSGSVSHAIVTSNRALLYNEIGQTDEAVKAIQKASTMAAGELRAKGRDNISFKINEGLIQYSAGNYIQAELIFNQVLELKRKRMARNQTDYANVENYLASVLMESGKTDQVPVLLNDALRIFDKKLGKSHPAYIKTKHNLGRYQIFVGNYAAASITLQDVNNSYANFFGKSHPDYLSSLEDLAVVAWKQQLYSTANERFNEVVDANLALVEKYFGAMSEYEKSKYWSKVRPSLLKFYSYAVERGTVDQDLLVKMYNTHLKTKGILLSASTKVRQEILNGSNEELKELYLNWVTKKEELILYYSYSKNQLTAEKIDLQSIENEANNLEKELNRKSTAFAASNQLPKTTVADVRTALKSGGAAIETISFPAFTNRFTNEKQYAFLVVKSNDAKVDLVTITNGNDLEQRYAKAYRKMVEIKAVDRITYDKFWRPIDEKLTGVSNLYLSLDGIYYQINVGALRRDDATYVSDGMNLHLYSSTRDIVTQSTQSSSRKSATFFGFPTYGSKGLLVPLPGTKTEIEAVSQITKSKGYVTRSFLELQANEANFKSAHAPTLLHIATHGFFLPEQSNTEKVFGIEVNQANENPLLRSGLMLANAEQTMDEATHSSVAQSADNGVLTAYEVITKDLANTELVVLSACETGLGEIKSGEGVYGLQRAFQVAGADSMIMSLWKVSDEATKRLMTNFYQQWMSGKKKEEAFFAAQKSLREQFPEPYYWGAFVMLN